VHVPIDGVPLVPFARFLRQLVNDVGALPAKEYPFGRPDVYFAKTGQMPHLRAADIANVQGELNLEEPLFERLTREHRRRPHSPASFARCDGRKMELTTPINATDASAHSGRRKSSRISSP
jgi:hypothetical protein